jgi:hypothetical protein
MEVSMTRHPSSRTVLRRATSALAAGAGIVALSGAAVPATPLSANADPQPKLTVVLDSLLCHVTQDNSGPDEPYLLGNGVRIWGNGSLNNEQSANVNASFDGQGTATIKLYEADLGFWPDYDDYLGKVTVTADQIDQGTQTVDVKGDGAWYEVTYHVNSRG